jgi:hypothetical protein
MEYKKGELKNNVKMVQQTKAPMSLGKFQKRWNENKCKTDTSGSEIRCQSWSRLFKNVLRSNRKHFIPINLGNLRISFQNSIQVRVINWKKLSDVIFSSNIPKKNFNAKFYFSFEKIKWAVMCQDKPQILNSTNCEIQARIISGNRCYYSCGALMESRALNRS